MSQHYIEKCSCGKVLSQCRCPSHEKEVKVIQDGCVECKAKAKTGDASWKKLQGLQIEIK
jgi:hypothetical protein